MANVPSVGPLYHIAYSDLIRSRISWMVLSPESKDTGLEYFTKKNLISQKQNAICMYGLFTLMFVFVCKY